MADNIPDTSNPPNTQTILDAVKKASAQWQAAFNAGDAVGCAAVYEAGAVMNAKPLGTFTGTGQILGFWTQLIAEGYTSAAYSDLKIEAKDETTAVLTAEWEMNNASGVIHRELWILQPDGTAKLREADFEVTG
ncbi:MAG: DUF4440 domain-containing protein [Chthoniobacterales bacterium]